MVLLSIRNTKLFSNDNFGQPKTNLRPRIFEFQLFVGDFQKGFLIVEHSPSLSIHDLKFNIFTDNEQELFVVYDIS